MKQFLKLSLLFFLVCFYSLLHSPTGAQVASSPPAWFSRPRMLLSRLPLPRPPSSFFPPALLSFVTPPKVQQQQQQQQFELNHLTYHHHIGGRALRATSKGRRYSILRPEQPACPSPGRSCVKSLLRW
ncbi:hypothetical protein F5B20DRAFT_173273 [Whalleya microplaca]|nr:hypothetical protein F5B20DRAFT_173273 [Whalleya microplaca]